jgi:hypothetical protein
MVIKEDYGLLQKTLVHPYFTRSRNRHVIEERLSKQRCLGEYWNIGDCSDRRERKSACADYRSVWNTRPPFVFRLLFLFEDILTDSQNFYSLQFSWHCPGLLFLNTVIVRRPDSVISLGALVYMQIIERCVVIVPLVNPRRAVNPRLLLIAR